MLLVLAALAAAEKPEELAVEQIRARIRKHRTAEVTLTVTDADGEPLGNTAVTVRQVRHKFLFGCNAIPLDPASDSKLQRDYRKRFAGLLNFATLPFYWGGYERAEGRTRARRLKAMAEWCGQNGITAKGHPLCWHNAAPAWLDDEDSERVLRLQLARIEREVGNFAGLVDTWDVVNEAVVMPRPGRRPNNPISLLCRDVGRVELISRTFGAAREANPEATLLLNDFDTSKRYERLIRESLHAGVEIGAIGIQSHMHKGYWPAKKAWAVCERFAKFKKPLHFTEVTILSGPLKTDDDWFGRRDRWDTTAAGEKRQAEQAVEFYMVLFSHPAVEAITWWDFSDWRSWMGAPSGLLRKDMTPKPVYEELMKLVKGEWWTGELKLTTDAAGRVKFRGFLGDYEVETEGRTVRFNLFRAGLAELSVKLTTPKVNEDK
ncbi:MAG: endo-1,4-beta-xylanase [Planctomycetota bacterium]|jgi:GH35 family endo-1,4-beta-xylanase